jgi:tetratricopeptide (TPR) repeat protein
VSAGLAAAEPDSFAAAARAADEARSQGRVSEAIAHYNKALELKGDWPEGWWYLGTLSYSADRHAEAVRAFAEVLKRYPSNGAAWAFIGLSRYELGEYPAALEALEKARRTGVGDEPGLVVLTRYRLGTLLTRFSRFDEARRELEGVAKAGREQEQVALALGLAALLIPRLPAEVEAAARGPAAAVGQALFLAATSQRPEAAARFQKALEAFPATLNIHYAHGVFLLGEDPERALAEFRRELERSPSHVPARLQIANECLRAGEAASALPHAKAAAETAPDWYLSRQMLGRALLASNDVSGAIRELEAAVALAPEDRLSRFHLANAYRSADRTADAARQVEEFQKLEKLDKDR